MNTLLGISHLAVAAVLLAPTAVAQVGCDELAGLQLPDVRVTEAAAVTPTADASDGITAPHCRVTGVIGREIGFELLLPDEWNGRFTMGGGGGFVGSIQNAASWTVDLGYATVGTDTGHQGPGAAWALDHPERQVNFGHLAVHRTAEVAKAFIRARYGSGPTTSYFVGCSRGGGQALMEAQRYPDDFDGIVAGAPAYDWTGFGAEMIQNTQKSFPDPAEVTTPIVSPETLRYLESRILDACDALDGVTDGVMEDPRDCPFDLGTIPACPDDRPGPACLTDAQRAAVAEVYAPAKTSDGTIVHPGWPFGGEGEEGGWQTWITGIFDPLVEQSGGRYGSLHAYFGTETYRYFVFGDPEWDYSTYDFSNWQKDTEFAAAVLNATDPDLSRFASHGGRLLLWHGWSDPALSALSSVEYHDRVSAGDPAADDYFRMFLLPGVLHCGGGPGPSQVDWLGPLVEWVEEGTAPERLVATKTDADGAVVRTRPLCAYPERAVYSGSGSTEEAASFECRELAP